MRISINGILTLFLVFWCTFSVAQEKKNVLVVHSYHPEHVWVGMLREGIDKVFVNDSDVRLFHEYLDAKRFPKLGHASEFFSHIEIKYASQRPDIIMVSDDAALQAVLGVRETLFSETPLVFMGINQVSEQLSATPGVTGVFENRNIAKTVRDLKVITGSDELIVISDLETAGQANMAKAKQAENHPEAPEKLHFVDQIEKDDAIRALGTFAPDIPILIVGQVIDTDAGGALMGWREGAEFLSSQLPNPVFSIGIITMEHGTAGAHNLDGVLHGAQAANLAKQIVSGKPADSVSEIINAESLWILDWQLMKKHGYTANQFPESALLVNNDESFYQRYKLLVWSVVAAFAIAIVVIILLAEIIRRGNKNRDILIENDNRYKDLAQVGSIIFWESDADNQITYTSSNVSTFLNTSPGDVLGRSLLALFENKSHIEVRTDELRRLVSARAKVENLVLRIHGPDSRDVQVFLLNATPRFDSNTQFCGYRGVLKEVTEEHQLSQKLAYLAAYDSITGLMNRTSFYRRLAETVAAEKASSGSAWVCFLDLDRFKTVNDTAGHLVGDAMLSEVGKVILECIEPADHLGRLGGDEFGLVLNNRSPAEAKQVCDNIVTAVSEYHFQWQDRLFSVGVSVGVVPVIAELNEIELLSKADLACYKAKETGRGRVYITDSDHSDLYDEELEMGYIANVSQALQQDRFYLVKQPICALANQSDDVSHYEFLLRYKDEHGNLVSPAVFVPAAEKHGVIGLIDRWVVRKVFEDYATYFPNHDVMVSINLSGISLGSETFVEEIEGLMQRSQIKPENICFEITETAAISQWNQAQTFIKLMKTRGVRFALDDFGSGTSSFGYLKQLPVDYIKIDGSLIRNIVSEETDQAIVSSITSIAHLMGIKTIAEFVETDEIRKHLANTGVDYVQGYAVGRPE